MSASDTVSMRPSRSETPKVVTAWGATLVHVTIYLVASICHHPGSSFRHVVEITVGSS